MTVFVSIASYRDTELLPTVKSLCDNSDYPDLLHISVVSQDVKGNHPDLSFVKNLSYIKMDFTEARGVGYARKIAMESYSGEDFYFQIDSHTRLAPSWDTKMQSMYSWCSNKENTDKIILSQFPAPYEIHTDGSIYYPRNHSELWDRPSWSKVHNRDHGAWSALRQEIKDLSHPHPSETILAGYLFAKGTFAEEIPYDERISFMGEELCLALRAYTRGWKIYAPNEILMWHFYKRKNSPKIWNQTEDIKRPLKWIEMEMESKRIQKNILTGKEQGVFGIGDYNKYLEYQKNIEIDFNLFYNKEINEKINNNVTTQEIIF